MNWQKITELEIIAKTILASHLQCKFSSSFRYDCSFTLVDRETSLSDASPFANVFFHKWMKNGLFSTVNGWCYFCVLFYIKNKNAIESFKNQTYHMACGARKIDFDRVFRKMCAWMVFVIKVLFERINEHNSTIWTYFNWEEKNKACKENEEWAKVEFRGPYDASTCVMEKVASNAIFCRNAVRYRVHSIWNKTINLMVCTCVPIASATILYSKWWKHNLFWLRFFSFALVAHRHHHRLVGVVVGIAAAWKMHLHIHITTKPTFPPFNWGYCRSVQCAHSALLLLVC